MTEFSMEIDVYMPPILELNDSRFMFGCFSTISVKQLGNFLARMMILCAM